MLGRAIEADKLRLASGTLSAYEELQVELRLVRERAELNRVQRERAAIRRQAAMAEVTLRSTRARPRRGRRRDEGGSAPPCATAWTTSSRAVRSRS